MIDNGDIVADHRSDNDRPAESKSVIGEQTSQNPSGPTNPGSAPAIATTSPGGDPSSSTPSADPLAQKAQVMMAALTQRGGDSYVFSTEVVDRIRGRLGEVKNPAVLEQIKKDRQVIRKAFSSDNPLPRNLGLILALSRSTNSGAANSKQDLWHLPDFVIAQYAGSDSANTNRDSEQSAWIAATHMRHLVIDVFRGEQNLLYAVACFGLSDQKARDLQRNLQQIDPNGQRRLNFWSMVEQQVVTGEEVEQVVRFLAAAIVAQNPSEYGIQMPPFSDL